MESGGICPFVVGLFRLASSPEGPLRLQRGTGSLPSGLSDVPSRCAPRRVHPLVCGRTLGVFLHSGCCAQRCFGRGVHTSIRVPVSLALGYTYPEVELLDYDNSTFHFFEEHYSFIVCVKWWFPVKPLTVLQNALGWEEIG